MTQEITIKAKDGSGSFMAYVARPENKSDSKEDAPVVILIQEIFGVNKVMRGLCDAMAEKGFIAVCPDLFWRQEPGIQITDQTKEEWDQAFKLFNGFDVDKGIDDLKATLDHVRSFKGSNGKVGTVGYCLGGKLAYLMATRSDADCNVSYYGVGLDALLDEAKDITKPLILHIAEKDKFAPKEAQEKVMKGLEKNDLVTIYYYYDMDHAFARTGGEHYDEASATLANDRTEEFLETHLRAA